MRATAMPIESERQLVLAAKAGENAAFDRFLARYRRRIVALCWRNLGSRELAEDAAQEVCLRAWRYLGGLDIKRGAWPWLASITRRVCCDIYRKSALERRDRSLDAPDAPEIVGEGIEEGIIDTAACRSDVVRALSTLPARYRRLFLLQALEGWSYEELAAADGSTVTSIAKVLTRAREKLRLSLGDNFGLAPLFGSIRLVWMRARARFDELRSGGAAENLLSAGVSLAIVGMMILALSGAGLSNDQARAASDGLSDAARPGMASVGRVGSLSRVQPSNSSPSRTDGDESLPITPPYSVRVQTGRQRDGAIDPTGGYVGVEVRDKDGNRVGGVSNRFECSDDRIYVVVEQVDTPVGSVRTEIRC